MKKPTVLKIALFTLILLQSIISHSQNFKDFAPRYNNENLRGDILLIGNSILNRDTSDRRGGDGPDVPYTGKDGNHNFNMKYIDIDGDPDTFNSSSASLALPDAACSKVVYAGLYWSAVTRDKTSRPKPIDKVKFKMPGGSYIDIQGTVIYDAKNSVIGSSYPYASYANVTDYFTKSPRPNPQGVYTVANVSTAEGSNSNSSTNTGLSAGWSLFIVYENATLPAKAITSFDGFSAIDASNNLDIEVSGFKAIKDGPVRAKFAFSALEGDLPIVGDFLAINGVALVPPERPTVDGKWEEKPFWIGGKWEWHWVWTEKYNFFNSTVTSLGSILNNRTPNSSNTLGFDAGVFEVNNPATTAHPGGYVIKNGDTSAKISLGSTGDVYFYYFNAFAIEIIAPRIVLVKKVIGTDENGKDYDASNKNIGIDKDLKYEIEFQNKGNDDAVNFTITDVLPHNIIFDEKKDILYKSPGVTVASYDKATRTIVFNIDPILVKAKGGISSIKFRVKTIKDCESLTDACSNVIKNTASSKYKGVINPTQVGGDSLASEEGCDVGEPSATNFLIGLDKCKFEQTLFLCGTVKLKAGGGYKTYVWTDDKGVVFGGNNQEVTVTKSGTYTVVTTATSPCLGIQQKFIVKDYAANINNNPINNFADNIDPDTGLPFICKNDLKPFPKIFLCGKNATKTIETEITGATSIVWQETNDPPPASLSDLCPDVTAQNWKQVEVGPTYTANKAGTFRLVVTYGNSCVNTYYFNVTQSLLDPTFIKEDIVCGTKGSITVTNPKPNDGLGYVYSLDGKTYQDSNVFDDVAEGRYTVHIKTNAVDNKFEKCIYTVDVTISELKFSTTVETTDPLCIGELGTIKATANGVNGAYQFRVFDSLNGDLKGDSGQIADPTNFHLFTGIAPGKYNVEITSEDGCKEVKNVTINDYTLKATATITKPLTCEDGEITVVVTGGKPVAGTPPYYYYYVNEITTPFTNPVISMPTAGKYDIVVVDGEGCSVTIPTIIVKDNIKPTATIAKKDIDCFGSETGEISISLDITDSPYTATYSINGTAGPFSAINPIKNLPVGDYDVVVKYTFDNIDCFDESKIITIGGSTSALTAAAGISELSGCGPKGNELQGKVRITNAEGGTPFAAPNLYKYSFDDQKTWIDSNEAYIDPRPTPYTFYIKDAAGCVFPMAGIILKKKPDAPTIEVSTPTFSCDGNASTTVTVTNTGGNEYEYVYLFNGVENKNNPPNVFINVPPSTPGNPHKISVNYKLVSAPTYSNLLLEDFGVKANINSPDTQSPGINKAFCFERQVEATKCNNDKLFGNGEYTVTNSLKNNPYPGWHNPASHYDPSKPMPTDNHLRKYLAVDAGTAIPNNAVLYRKTIKDIIKGQPIQVRFFATNLLKFGNTQPDASLTVELQNSAGVALSHQSTGKIPKTDGWVEYIRTIDPGDNTTLDFVLRLEVSQIDGIDFAVDDIEVYQLPKSCLSTQVFDVVVDPDRKFSAAVKNIVSTKCKGNKDGSVTIFAYNFDTTNGFEYSIDKGLNWINSKTQETIVSGLAEGPQDIRVRFSKDVTGCNFNFTPSIGSPDAFVVDANATAANCLEGAKVTASAIGGTGAYTFTLTDSATPPNVVNFPSDGILTKVAPGTYIVSGVDANGCSDNKDTALVIDAPIPPKAKIEQNTGLCFNGSTATLTVTITDGVDPYYYQVKYNGGTYSDKIQVNGTLFNYQANATGTYDFLITDNFGCTALAVGETINPILTAEAFTTSSLACVDPKKAVIEVTIKDGTGPFTYIVKNSAGNQVATSTAPIPGPKFTYEASTAGTYTFEITDKNGCTTKAEGTVAAITNPDVTATPTNPKCKGESNGSVTLLGSLGSGSYKYKFNSTSFTDETIYTGLKAGVSYPYQVMDTNGCVSEVKYIELSEPDVITPTVRISEQYTCEHKATITASATGGNGTTYTYVLNITRNSVTTTKTNTTGIFEDLTDGSYSVTISDSKGCTVTETGVTIAKLDPPTAMVIKNTDLKCPSNEVEVEITSVTGGTLPFQYAIQPAVGATISWQPENKFEKLAPDTYTFMVKDAKGCIYSAPHTINPLVPAVIRGEVVKDVSCLGELNGKAKFTITGLGNDVDYSYTIDGGTVVTGKTLPAPASTTLIVNADNLAKGEHTLTLTVTATNCPYSGKVEILAPDDEFKITPTTVTPQTCITLGKAVVNTTGGWGGNRYTITLPDGTTKVGPQDSNTFTNLTATGEYNVLVVNSKGCEVTGVFTLDPIVEPKADIDATSDLCYDLVNKATIVVKPAIDPSPTYVYSIDGGINYQPSGTFSDLIPGDYVVRVWDKATGCKIDLPSKTIAKQLTASVKVTKEVDCTTTPDVIIAGEVFEGTAPYTYTVSVNGVAEPGVTDITDNKFLYTNVVATTANGNTEYIFEIKDAIGCITTSTVIVKPKTDPVFTATANSSILCNGADSGSITVDIDTNFGVGPYVIDVYNKTTSTPYFTQTTGLPAGEYRVTVTDSKSCSFIKDEDISIVEPDPIVAEYRVTPITCGANGVSLGKIFIDRVTGGTKNYTYHVTGLNYNEERPDKDGSGEFFEIVDFGYYEITITDKNGCSKVISDILVASPPDDLDIEVKAPPADCSTGGSAVVSIGLPVTGGTITGDGPFYFAIYDGSKPNFPDPVGAFAWLPEDGPKSKKATFNNLTPGVKYTFIVYDSDAAHGGTGSGCYYYETAEEKIPTNSDLEIDNLQAKNITCLGADNGNVTLKVSSPYTVPTDVNYQIFNELTLAPMGGIGTGIVPAATVPKAYLEIDNFGNLPFGNYFVLVTEVLDRTTSPIKTACSVASLKFKITGSVTALELKAESTKNANCNPNQGIVVAFAEGGTTFAAVVAVPAIPGVPATPGVPAIPAKPAIPASPAIPYLYQIVVDNLPLGEGTEDNRPSEASFDIDPHPSNTFNVEAGNYLVYVRDAYGCITSKPVTVELDASPVITADIDPSLCTATNGNYTINVNITTLGVGPYTYSLNGGNYVSTQTAPLFTISNLGAGKYKIKVKDLNGCISNEVELEIFQPLDLKASFTTPPVCENADGTITAVATYGSGDFEFILVNKATPTIKVTQPTGIFENLAAGSYTVTVIDKITTCDKSVDVDLPLPTLVVLVKEDIVTTAPYCTNPVGVPAQGNDSNGTIKVNLQAVNNNPEYKYILTPVADPVAGLKTNIHGYFDGLAAGDYDVTVKSGRGCAETIRVNIKAPTPVSATVVQDEFKCDTNVLKDIIVTITPEGGAANGDITKYKYSKDNNVWVDSNTFNVIDTEAPQTITYYVKDANNCVFSKEITIAPFPKLTAPTVKLSTTLIDCVNKQQEIDVTINGGSNTLDPFEYQVYINGVLDSAPRQTVAGNTFTYLAKTAGATYQFEIFDIKTTCSILSDIVSVPLFNKIEVVAYASTQVGCKGEFSGQIAIDISGYEGSYNYQILVGGVANTVLSGSGHTDVNPFVLPHLLAAGTDYTVVVTETEFPSCEKTSNVVIITEPVEELKLIEVTNIPQNCNTAGAVLTVKTVTGGTLDYTYGFAPRGTRYEDVVFSEVPTIIIPVTKLTAPLEQWDVYVRDKNGCYVSKIETIKADPIPSNIKARVASQCFNLLDPITKEYVINVTADGVGPFEYSLDGFNFKPSPLTVKSPGEYTVYARDANGCSDNVKAAFTILDPLGLSAEITTYPTCNDDKGVITLTGTGGTVSPTTSYQYAIGTDSFDIKNVFGGLSPGTHTFWIKDMITSCTTSITKEIPVATDIIIAKADLTPTHVSCNGGTDGTITVALNAGNNNPDYKFSLEGVKGHTRIAQASPFFKDLPADTYTITVISGRGCKGSATTVVEEPTAIRISTPAVTQFACTGGTNTSNTATIVVTATDGTPDNGDYKYVFIKNGATTADNIIVQSGKENTYTELGLTGGSYTITVSDKNNCSDSTTATINPFMSIDDVVITVVDVITCTNNGQNIKVVPTTTGIGVAPAFVYSITDENGNKKTDPTGTGVFNDLPVGQYLITVFNPETLCSLQRPHSVNAPNTFSLVASNVVNITCFGNADGSIEFTLVDSKLTPTALPNGFDYVITGPMATPITATSLNHGPIKIDNLQAGLYKIVATLKDSPFCPVEADFTIAGPISALELDGFHTDITCEANNNGIITAWATGGWYGTYEFQLELKGAPGIAVEPWSWTTMHNFTDLGPGDYVVKLRDLGKCEVSKDVTLAIPKEITATIVPDKLELTCFGDNGATITVTATGGSGKYLYTLEATYADGVVTKNGPQDSNVFTGLDAASYKVFVSDNWTCEGISSSIEIKDPAKVKASYNIKTIEGCDRPPVVTLSATGGTGPYKYGTDGNNFSGSFATSTDIKLPETTVKTEYIYYVQDALGCISDVVRFTFSPVPELVFSKVDSDDVNCKGSSTGSITVTAAGGLGNYIYTLLDAAGAEIKPAAIQIKPGQFDNLPAGNYFVRVNSDDCKTISVPVSINEPTTSVSATAVPTHVTCNNSTNGKIVVNATGGTGALRYAISPNFKEFFESNVFDNLPAGDYIILVEDENGCPVVSPVTIEEPPILDFNLIAGTILPEFCVDDKNGAFQIKIIGGTAPYRVALDDEKGTYEQILGDEHTFIGLVGGVHTVYIKDANDCGRDKEIETPESVKLDPIASINTDCVDNFGANFVTITVDQSNTNPLDLKYSLDRTAPQASNIFVNVPQGSHTVTVLHANGCEKTTVPFIIDEVQPLTLTLADGGLNEIVATATGGGGNYQYALDGEPYGSVNKFIIYKSGTYTVTVTDKNGCTATATRYFEYIDVCIPNHFTPNGDGINDTWAPGCTVNYKDLTFDIFDRYGRVICKYKLGQKWDGRYNGNELPSGDYWYVLKLNDKKDDREFVGHFTLYR
ncbi:T9SS type B sorting domain-containing protein [Flavobacterium branchiarum]|uniref:T9SS type B sorting domain-containing protein n=1 Tax=Flavobacterium branchiarum TaxID=1114870 RepID=A0ABV5FJN8_9FLAO|nr:T9SS type B sorting domain-containing protein [Flavobacterium branchiarum]MDN3675436.1 T9SS type B sorting domain-containing protein [Flavobacterium branchiarum]